MSHVRLDHPWLEFDLGGERQVLSWSVNRPGLVSARRILWRELRNADLPPDFDVDGWVARELSARNATDAVTLLTSRDIRQFTECRTRAGAISVHAVATVGLSNAERIGQRMDWRGQDWGTINVGLCIAGEGLTEAGFLEAMSIATQARTTAVIEAGLQLPTGLATGTGTDCIALAAPAGPYRYAGLHTDMGEAIGRAVYTAVRDGARDWLAEQKEAQKHIGRAQPSR